MTNINILATTTRTALQTNRGRSITVCQQCYRRLTTGAKVFEEGDVVLLRGKKDGPSDGVLSKPLSSTGSMLIPSYRSEIPHSNIIGKRIRDIVQAGVKDGRKPDRKKKPVEFRVYEPTLAEYVRLTPRVVTPIYPSDANLIVSLLDIHVSPPSTSSSTADSSPLEILEAGTGHGALTLHLSRAIHAANPPVPVQPIPSSSPPDKTEDSARQIALATWKQQRRAVLHTLDIAPAFQAHARAVVRRFRRGQYFHNVDFHHGDVSEWVVAEMEARKTTQPFLSHIFLDLPGADTHLENVAPALHVDGILAVFNPSITQIAECVELVRRKKLPYLLEQVVELGASATVRQWDVRAVRTKASLMKKGHALESEEEGEGEMGEGGEEQVSRDTEMTEDLAKGAEDEYAMVCRPKVGEKIVGGGFLGLWRRMRGPADL